LTDQTWQLSSLNGADVSGENKPILAFGKANNILGSTGCNLFTGTFLIGGQGAINLSPVVTSATDCPEALRAQEEAVIMALTTASTYKIEGDTLLISNPDNSQRAAFEKIAPLTLEGTSWVLNAYNDGQGAIVAPIGGTQVTAEFEAGGNLSGSAGCKSYSATYEATEQTIQISPPVSTKMLCAQPEGVMDQETRYLQALEKATAYRNFGIALVLYDENEQPLKTYTSSSLIASLRFLPYPA
jgi:heat shock protein HslJ